MAELKILAWNIEHFNGSGGVDANNRDKRLNRVADVIELIKAAEVDVFGLSEVEGSDVHQTITAAMPGFTFHLTEGRQSQEILIGARNGLTTFFSQRDEFKRSNPFLRPGALLTVTLDGVHVPILFVHLKAMSKPEGFGLRDAMFDKVFNLKKKLDETSQANSGAPASFIFVGDMNTVGMNYDGVKFDIPGPDEVGQVIANFSRRGMRHLSKSHNVTFSNGSRSSDAPSDLDHVFAAEHLRFKAAAGAAEVAVGGWAAETTADAQDDWIAKFSDHAPLVFTLDDI